MFSCKRLDSRKDAFNAVKSSGILSKHAPGFEVGHWDFPPHLKGSPRTLASTWDSEYGVEIDYDSYDITPVLDPLSHKILAFRVGAKSSLAESQYLCTSGCVVELSDERYYLLPAHPFTSERNTSQDMTPEEDSQSEDDDCVFSGFENETELEDETDFMTQHSATPETSDAEDEWNLDYSDSSSDSDFDDSSQIQHPRNEKESIPAFDDAVQDIRYKTGLSRPLRSLYRSPRHPHMRSDNLDYIRVEVRDKMDLSTDFPTLSIHSIGQLQNGTAPVTAVTGAGNYLVGVLSSGYECIRLPNATNYVKVQTVQFERFVQSGDCGSIVRDARSGRIYGHIVAGDPGSQTAFIIPAIDVFNDILTRHRPALESFMSERRLPRRFEVEARSISGAVAGWNTTMVSRDAPASQGRPRPISTDPYWRKDKSAEHLQQVYGNSMARDSKKSRRYGYPDDRLLGESSRSRYTYTYMLDALDEVRRSMYVDVVVIHGLSGSQCSAWIAPTPTWRTSRSSGARQKPSTSDTRGDQAWNASSAPNYSQAPLSLPTMDELLNPDGLMSYVEFRLQSGTFPKLSVSYYHAIADVNRLLHPSTLDFEEFDSRRDSGGADLGLAGSYRKAPNRARFGRAGRDRQDLQEEELSRPIGMTLTSLTNKQSATRPPLCTACQGYDRSRFSVIFQALEYLSLKRHIKSQHFPARSFKCVSGDVSVKCPDSMEVKSLKLIAGLVFVLHKNSDVLFWSKLMNVFLSRTLEPSRDLRRQGSLLRDLERPRQPLADLSRTLKMFTHQKALIPGWTKHLHPEINMLLHPLFRKACASQSQHLTCSDHALHEHELPGKHESSKVVLLLISNKKQPDAHFFIGFCEFW
ncbi:hypothetical protein N7532_007504 [Penicillium argentinense]|uniref:Uncharacterized protein n=1 Tax=Penicillium argentinense TaxID=1131581 RepID=A0A9W9F7W0_9EURO|nr:uncharacterized protein N7532_007504 [Penicillium argentinense]KAJ5095213.1 hypothetical protein N7532_007504 [Penicillium argentinense]